MLCRSGGGSCVGRRGVASVVRITAGFLTSGVVGAFSVTFDMGGGVEPSVVSVMDGGLVVAIGWCCRQTGLILLRNRRCVWGLHSSLG